MKDLPFWRAHEQDIKHNSTSSLELILQTYKTAEATYTSVCALYVPGFADLFYLGELTSFEWMTWAELTDGGVTSLCDALPAVQGVPFLEE